MYPTTQNFLLASPVDFASYLVNQNLSTVFFYIPIDGRGELTPSHPSLLSAAKNIEELPDFKAHEGIFVHLDSQTQCLYMVFVHSTVRGQAQGGTRLNFYCNIGEAIVDGLRLSKGMTDKNCIANLWWGGGKAIICPLTRELFADLLQSGDNPGLDSSANDVRSMRSRVFQNYGRFVTSLGGIYIAAEDLNTTPNDMADIFSQTRYVTCIPEALGGSGNPSKWTAQGVAAAMLAAVQHSGKRRSLKDITVNLLGVGNVGRYLAAQLLAEGAQLTVYDLRPENIDAVLCMEGDIRAASTLEELLQTPCDIFSPCAVGGILNESTIPILRCNYVIGAANNQLKNPESDYCLLAERGITYLPDFFINCMGIINCANEQYGRLDEDLTASVQRVYEETRELLVRADKNELTPQEESTHLVKERLQKHHPIWGGTRGRRLLEAYRRKTQLVSSLI